MEDKLDKKIGTKESIKLQPGSFLVKMATIQPVKRKSGEAVGEKVVLAIQHPDSQEHVDLSSAIYLKNKSLKQSALWYQEDQDKNIPKSSTLAAVMRHYKVDTVRQFEGKVVETELDENGYLCIKAY